MIYRSEKTFTSQIDRLKALCRIENCNPCRTCGTQHSIRNLSDEALAKADTNRTAFSLIEAVTAVMLLALLSSSVLVVIDRCNVATIDSTMRMQAFEVARDNMEALLSQNAVSEMADFGISEKYPAVEWQTTVEAFYEPLTVRMWIQAVCSAEYTDSAGEKQTVQLTHWLTDLTKEQLLEMLMQRQQEYKPERLIASIEDAAEYAGADIETIEQWLENGMLQTADGEFIKDQLDLYKQTNGKPTPEDRMRLLKPDDKTAEQPDKILPEAETGETPSTNPLGLPDDYPDWPIEKILEWLNENGKL